MYSDYDKCLSAKLHVSNTVNIPINSTSLDDISGCPDIDALLMYQIFGRHKKEF